MASIKRCKSTKKFEAFQVESSIEKQTWGNKYEEEAPLSCQPL